MIARQTCCLQAGQGVVLRWVRGQRAIIVLSGRPDGMAALAEIEYGGARLHGGRMPVGGNYTTACVLGAQDAPP